VIDDYVPPADKRLLVVLQCSVRRPFSSSPSHGSMRRAIRVATGADPAGDFEACPVHVVVLASRIGPVPYELEDVYPANVGGGGVKHFRDEHYGRVRPILAARMAEYLTAHRDSYDHAATFTDARYGEVMRDARELAGMELPIFPRRDGPAVVRMGKSKPRTYWQKYWIQLFLEIVGRLARARRVEAKRRLEELDVVYR
jgi:predicted RNA-binding protein